MSAQQISTYEHCSFEEVTNYLKDNYSQISKTYLSKEKEIINNRNIESEKIANSIKMTDKKYHQSFSL